MTFMAVLHLQIYLILLLGCCMFIGVPVGMPYYCVPLKLHSLLRKYKIQGVFRYWRCLHDQPSQHNLWNIIPSIIIFIQCKTVSVKYLDVSYLSHSLMQKRITTYHIRAQTHRCWKNIIRHFLYTELSQWEADRVSNCMPCFGTGPERVVCPASQKIICYPKNFLLYTYMAISFSIGSRKMNHLSLTSFRWSESSTAAGKFYISRNTSLTQLLTSF